jgi:hypothetical protein
MATIGQIRGALLEEAVFFLLNKVGYKIIYKAADSSEPSGIRDGHSGLALKGRGTWHQIDALAECNTSPAFMYPLRLLVEAKFYDNNVKIQLPVVRNFFGVEKDISENYFTKRTEGDGFSEMRFNYRAAILSVSGYSAGAVEFAIAHQIFLIEYRNIPIIIPVIDAIASFDDLCLTKFGKAAISEVRAVLRDVLRAGTIPLQSEYITDIGLGVINRGIGESIRCIGGSYFGMLQGRYPMHFLTESPINPEAVSTDIVYCRLRGNKTGQWSFTPVGVEEDSQAWFRLQFSLPTELARRIASSWEDRETVANIKAEHFSFVNLSGVIGGIHRNIRLELDRGWLNQYLNRNHSQPFYRAD